MMFSRFRVRRGFTLIELAVALAVVGVLSVAMAVFLPKINTLPAFSQHAGNTSEQATRAIDGFILANSRLPCPDSSADGTGEENCADGNIVGWLPTRTLGISLSEPVRYGVYRQSNAQEAKDYDLAVLKNRYVPLLPDSYATTYPKLKNGLDFCIGLLNLTEKGGTVLSAGSSMIPIAYGIATAGKLNADNRGVGKEGQFDGLNSVPGRFELAGQYKSAVYDDDTRTVGSAELFERLGCTQKLASVNSVGRAAYVAYDVDQVAEFYVRFRTFQIKVRELDLDIANTARDLAATDIAISAAKMAVAITLLSQTKDPLKITGAQIGVAAATAGTLAAANSLVGAIKRVSKAEESLATARKQKVASEKFKAETSDDLSAAMDTIKLLDTKGILL